ncbi:hypothetical protein DFH08DRAFT_475002 [Mycena albidolilacea]|uniref:Uncharacterized protein n=1 Tax=Mycena albidolilacea TaxID=1033008 RepID=A0AAD7AGQ2_9AGAR|nr:hypothetical protein DFH08DRAFT_475002 [Mycena albidolilacea]
MVFHCRRKEIPWEVVDSRAIEPVHMYYDEDKDLDIVSVGDADTCGTYVFNVEQLKTDDLVVFARQQLLKEVGKKGFNVLLSESWDLTIYRRGKHHRVQVSYSGRPARIDGDLPPLRPPPFMQVLQDAV